MEQEQRKLKNQTTTETKGLKKSKLTPDSIMNTLFQMHSAAHYYHLQTTNFSQHKMLNDLYEALEEHKDTICEYLLGKQAPRRFGILESYSTPAFSPAVIDSYLTEGCTFAEDLCDYAEGLDDEELCNKASDLLGTFVKSKYLNTLK